ncbi:Cholecystokinin receptor [Papilio xuthus]|uniref:Cholecystokinin receptor n=1 Tax=Papilio xuthus TaxID=66420 RepID=A0A194PCZ3_PAPXU|nr:Cholecystokinin receptor [Papilio xuthus]
MENLTLTYNVSLLLAGNPSSDTTMVSVHNSSVTSNAYEWRFVLPPYFIIFMLSISGNCLVITTLASNRRMRTVTNVYLLNLAISDFLLGVFCLPFTLVGQIYRRFLFGAILCKLIPYLQAVSVSVDVWTLVAISLERYFAICRPLKSRKWQTQCHAYKMIAMVWMLSLVLNAPILIVSTLQPMRGDAYKCREVWTSLELERAFNLGLDAALLLVPFFIMSFAYCLIVTKLWRGMRHEIQHNFNWQKTLTREESCKSNHLLSRTSTLKSKERDVCYRDTWGSKNMTKQENNYELEAEKKEPTYCMHTDIEFRHVVRSTHIDKSIEAKRKVIRMLFVIILEFFVCWTPLHVINTIYLFYPDKLYQYIGSKGIVLLQLLAYCSSCCNPITYCFMNRKFRQAFINLLKSCKLFKRCFPDKSESGKQATPPPSSQDGTACVSWMDWKERSVFSSGSHSGSHSTALGSCGLPAHPALPAPVISRPVTQVIETGEEGSQFLYRITWPRTAQAKGNVPAQPLYE